MNSNTVSLYAPQLVCNVMFVMQRLMEGIIDKYHHTNIVCTTTGVYCHICYGDAFARHNRQTSLQSLDAKRVYFDACLSKTHQGTTGNYHHSSIFCLTTFVYCDVLYVEAPDGHNRKPIFLINV